MKYFLTFFILCFSLNILSAQEKHFVFLQSESKQPFYVSVNGKLYSSSASGYLIIPKLAEGNYKFTVGFAQNAHPEQTFTCFVQNKDLGFELKNFNDKGWGLFNLQTLDITMATTANSGVVAKALSESENKKVPDGLISFDKKKEQDKPVSQPVVETAAVDTGKPSDEKGPVVILADATSSGVKAPDVAPVVNSGVKTEARTSTPESAPDVKKISEITREEGVHLSYVEASGKVSDTINVIIPSSPLVSSSNNSAVTSSGPAAANAETSRQANPRTQPVNSANLKFLDISLLEKKDTVDRLALKESNRIFDNTNCKNIATDEDYAKLRKKMAGETTDEKMINEAKKFFRNKCFTTNQIKKLSTLFLSDEGRFKFFDASFVSVADASLYSTLQTEFIDPAFVSRFKELIQ